MRTLTALALTLTLTGASYGQSSSVSVPIVVPPPPPFQVLVNQPLIIGGVNYQVTGTLTITPNSIPPPPPPALSAITGVTSVAGLALATAPGGGIIVVKGSGFGNFGTASVAGLPAVVQSWTPIAVTLKLPTGGVTAGSAIGPIILKPGDAPLATSSFDFAVTGLVAELPPPPPGPTWESPVLAVSQTVPDPPLIPRDCDQYLGLPLAPVDENLIPPPGPLVLAVLDSAGQPFTDTYNLDNPLVISGERFGETKGKVEVNGLWAEVLSWSDEKISARAVQGGAVEEVTFHLKTAVGSHYASFALLGGGG